MVTKKKPIKRKHTRFKPDPDTFAFIDVKTGREFKPQLSALVTEESFKGCSMVLLATESLQVESRCRVQVGKLGPMWAEVRWRQELDPQVIKIGLMYLE
jgi:hypothetical protein